MPTYDYRCPNGHDFEHFVRKISDAAAELVCPVCGAVAQRRVSGGAGLVFKGSGFYLTDYGKNAHRKSGGADVSGSTESKSDAGASSGGDSAKADGGSSTGSSGGESSGSAKSESSASVKSDGAKSTESKSSAKSKGGGGSGSGGSSGDSK